MLLKMTEVLMNMTPSKNTFWDDAVIAKKKKNQTIQIAQKNYLFNALYYCTLPIAAFKVKEKKVEHYK